MVRPLIVRLVPAALAGVLAAGAARAGDTPVYHFSPVNQYNLQVSASFWNPIIRYVSRRSGVPLDVKLGRTQADTTSYVLAREVDFAFTNHLFNPERARLGWAVFGRRDGSPLQGQIVVPADSPVRSLADLAGAAVAFPGPEAVVARAFIGMDKDPEGRRILATAAALVHAGTPLAFVAASDADYAGYRAFHATAPLAVR